MENVITLANRWFLAMDWRNCSEKRDVLLKVQKCIPGRKILYLYLIYINIDVSRQHYTELKRVQINSKTKKVTMPVCFCLGERCKFPRKILLEWGRERCRADTCEPQNWESTDSLSLSNPWTDNIQIWKEGSNQSPSSPHTVTLRIFLMID